MSQRSARFTGFPCPPRKKIVFFSLQSSADMAGCCCISHEFFKAASKNPSKVAVIHACGGAKVVREFRNRHPNGNDNIKDSAIEYDKVFNGHNTEYSSHFPVYEGDRCFTFSEILASVDSLSSRLRHILDGGSDPHLIRPSTGTFPSEQPVDVHILESNSSSLGVVQSTEYQHNHIPKILGICTVPSVEYVIAVLSVLRCGEAFMPLDPLWPKERILSIVSSSNVDLIIGCQSSFDGSWSHELDKSHWLVDCSSCPVLFITMKDNLQEKFGSSCLLSPCESKERYRSFCYLMYTSGSTGKPKGVCGTELGILNRYMWMQELHPLLGEDILFFKTSISFIDHLQEIFGALLAACTLVIPPSNELKENLFYMIDFLQAYSISRLIAVPSLMRAVLPALQKPYNVRIQSSLKLLVLSGEVLPLSLWDMLYKLLPKTTILNLYGSTEVSGDCTYFDCKRLPLILESEDLSSIPIGMPISNCDVVLVGEESPDQGEIYVGGICVAAGYFCDPYIMQRDFVKLPQDFCCDCSISERGHQNYFKTGDFARRLQSGDFVFIGRKDRTVKVNGQRIALEEIESTLRGHPDVVDAAVVSNKDQGELEFVAAYLVINQMDECGEILRSSIRAWMVDKLPLAMIPNRFFFTKSFPMSSTGKVDYSLLASLKFSMTHVQNEIGEIQSTSFLQVIKKAFCDALMVERVSNDDDFFAMGGNSISAAHVSHNLGIDMRLLYIFPSALMLQLALLQNNGLHNVDVMGVRTEANWGVNLKTHVDSMLLSFDSKILNLYSSKSRGRFSSTLHEENDNYPIKCLKVDSNLHLKGTGHGDGYPWYSNSIHRACSFSRCNKVIYEGENVGNSLNQAIWSVKIPRDKKATLQELWKVHLGSCVDASPIVVFKDQDTFLLIGSHSHKFLCINAKSGFVQWEIKLEGRIECSAAILGDFSQVVVGCYQGNIYFLDFLDGKIHWTFQTCGEVKSQPVVDKCRNLVWCGSYDHNLYALDYKDYCCVYKLPCGGSIYGSPAIDEVQGIIYVASTSGRITAISIKAFPFSKLWLRELVAPVFGSLCVNSQNGYVICCLVDGHVVALDSSGSTIWREKTGGPIFAGPCMSYALSSQVLICSRDGIIYSFEMESGSLLWEHNIGDPITSSAYVDEHLQLVSDPSHMSDRLICVCSSSGTLYLFRIHLNANGGANRPRKDVEEFSRLDLQGDIFSSPVMIGGRIFVGCRDDYVHCIGIECLISVET